MHISCIRGKEHQISTVRFHPQGVSHMLCETYVGNERRMILINQIIPIDRVEVPSLQFVVIWVVEVK